MEVSAATAKAYFNSPENHLLVPNRDFGRRKYVNVTMNRQFRLAKNKNANSTGNKQWVHPPETLLRGHIVYNVKFLGHVDVEAPKGSDIVKDSIRKMKFNKQIKKAEGQKTPKVELTISIDGVTIQDAKTKVTQHQYPLHRVSYCADDKSDKRMLTFIAKSADSDIHHCFVFESEKCAEEITLTIGQAFDLAYRRFLESHGRDMDMKKQFLLLQKKVQQLTEENLNLKARLADLERGKESKAESQPNNSHNSARSTEEPQVGRRLEGLLLDDASTPKTNGHINNTKTGTPVLAPPPVNPRSHHHHSGISSPESSNSTQSAGRDLFGAEPFGAQDMQPVNTRADPFGMGAFNPNTQDLDQQIKRVDQELLDLQTGFSQGLSFGTTDYSIEDFDPLN